MGKKKEIHELVSTRELLPDELIILPISARPVFPNIMVPITFTGEKFLESIKEGNENQRKYLGLVYIKEQIGNDLYDAKLYDVGTLVKIHKITTVAPNTIQVIVQGVKRFKKADQVMKNPYLKWSVDYEVEEVGPNTEIRAYMLAIMSSLKEVFKVNPILQEELKLLMSQVSYDKPAILMDLVASMLKTEGRDLQELLSEFNLEKRCQKLLTLLKKELEIAHLQEKFQKKIEDKVSKQQKEYFLREQLKMIKKELGMERDEKEDDLDKFSKRLGEIEISKEGRDVVEEQMEKLSILDKSSPEFHVTRSYIQSILELPWGIYSEESRDVKKSREILDEDHYGLKDVKKSILEFIGTIIKTKDTTGSILCFVGPPGVGKTSVGKSIAKALGRELYRFSVGGMRDEAEIKGHRRTYIGAMPGKIMQAIKSVKTSNPVIMLDEIDKIGTSFRGDPASALLEVLDPEQNKGFLDHYLDVRYDLSKVLFITTANQLDTIPRPLLDRMEVIKLPGYILEEKLEIAKKYLIPNQMKAHNLKKKEINITKGALVDVIDMYAREAGVRSLEKHIKKIMRRVTLIHAEGDEGKQSVTKKNLEEYLGKPIFVTEELYQRKHPGVVLGLAWTSMGGATLYIESAIVSQGGSPALKHTGQLGNVMKESMEIAYSYTRGLLSKNKKSDTLEKSVVHIHVPAGATPKDGPSAGITIALSLYSLAINKAVRKDIAMTGELTLTGKVLPIGGVREKVIAARRVGIYTLIIPKDNKKDFDTLPDYIKEGITVHPVDYFEDVLKVAFK